MAAPPHRLLLAGQRLVVRTSTGPIGRAWAGVYGLVARVVARALTRGVQGASVYTRAGTAAAEVVPGLSDVDLVVVVPRGESAAGEVERLRRRALRARSVPVVGRLLDLPCVYGERELGGLLGSSYATFGLGAARPPGAYVEDGGLLDRRRILERPGLYGDATDWRLLVGHERRPRRAPRDGQAQRVAGWLELAFWWRLAFEACVHPHRAYAAFLCVKLVAEPARIWLWLEHGERPSSRRDALERALERLPEERRGIGTALDLQARLHDLPPAPLAEVLPTLVRLSSRISAATSAGAHAGGSRAVRLLGTAPVELTAPLALVGPEAVGSHPPGAFPLCDWRALAIPTHADESLVPAAGDPGDPAVVADAAVARAVGTYRALRAAHLLLFPHPELERPLPRVVACPASDPVSFALLAGDDMAWFPEAGGWSIEDTARRALAEQRARLGRPVPAAGDRRALRALLAAARPALLLESAEAGDPVLPVTLSAVARLLGERSAAASVAAEADGALRDPGGDLAHGVVDRLREVVLGLPAYRGTTA